MSSTLPPGFSFPREYGFPPFFTRQVNQATLRAQLTKWSALVLAYCRHYRVFKLNLSGVVVPTAGSASSSSGGGADGSDAAAAASAAAALKTAEGRTYGDGELFHNRVLSRRLSPDFARELFDFMRRDGRAEWYGGGGAGSGSSGAGAGAGASTTSVATSGAAGSTTPAGVGGGGSTGAPSGGKAAPPADGNEVVWVYWKTPDEWAAAVEAWVEETGHKGAVMTLYELVEGDGTRGTGELLRRAAC